jgi:hypothetical protein
MLKSSQITRSAVIAATVMSIGASPAHARPADTPAASIEPAVTTGSLTTHHWTPARVESMGVRPVDSPATASPPAATPVTQPSDGSAGLQWLLFPLAALMLGFALILGGARAAWHAADTFRARHV